MNINDLNRLEKKATDFRNNGQIDKAVEVYDQLAAQYTLRGDTTHAAGMVHMIGVTYKVGNRTQESLSKLDEAKKMYEQAGDAVGAGCSLRDIAITHAYSGDYDAAELILMQSINQLKTTSNQDELALSHIKLGENYLKKGDLVSANEWIAVGWNVLESSDHVDYKITATMHRAELAYAELDHEKAEKLCRQAIDMIRAHHGEKLHKRRVAQLYGLLSLSKIARQEKSSEELDMTRYYLSQLDDDSRQYLLQKTVLKDLPDHEELNG